MEDADESQNSYIEDSPQAAVSFYDTQELYPKFEEIAKKLSKKQAALEQQGLWGGLQQTENKTEEMTEEKIEDETKGSKSSEVDKAH